jgi:hypothetical protein
MSQNYGSKHVKKTKSVIVSNLVNQKSDLELVELLSDLSIPQFDIYVLQYDLSMLVVLQIE